MKDDKFWPQVETGMINPEHSDVKHCTIESKKDSTHLKYIFFNFVSSYCVCLETIKRATRTMNVKKAFVRAKEYV